MDSILTQVENDIQQLAAVTALDDRPVIVLAGPGSGKTRVLASRAVWLALNLDYPESGLAMVTFTREAAGEMKHRVSRWIRNHHRMQISTIHSLCYKIIRDSGWSPTIVGDRNGRFPVSRLQTLISQAAFQSGHYTALVKARTNQVGWGWVWSWVEAARTALVPWDDLDMAQSFFQDRIQDAHAQDAHAQDTDAQDTDATGVDNGQRTPNHVASALSPWLADAYCRISSRMAEEDVIWYTDMLYHARRLILERPDLAQGRFSHVMVDELQDVGRLEMDVLDALAGQAFFGVGDWDQSIYRFREASSDGADSIQEYMRRHLDTQVIQLQTNYRSTRRIVALSQSLIAQSSSGTRLVDGNGKTVYADRNAQEGQDMVVQGFDAVHDEAAWAASQIDSLLVSPDLNLSPHDIFVIYRTNAQSQPFEEELLKLRIPFVTSSVLGFWDRAAAKDMLALAQLVRDPSNNEAFARVCNKASTGYPTPSRFLGRAFRDRCLEASPDGSLWGGMLRLHHTNQAKHQKWQRGITDLVGHIQELSTYSYTRLIGAVYQWYVSWRHRQDGSISGEDSPSENAQVFWEAAMRHPDMSSLLDYVHRVKGKNRKNRRDTVLLTTVHSAKGLEARVVFCVGMAEGVIPHWRSGGGQILVRGLGGRARPPESNPWLPEPYTGDLDDERNIAYVQITRAAERLYYSWSAEQGMKVGLGPSRFLEEMLATGR